MWAPKGRLKDGCSLLVGLDNFFRSCLNADSRRITLEVYGSPLRVVISQLLGVMLKCGPPKEDFEMVSSN